MSGKKGDISLISPWIRRFSHLVPGDARVLDLAAGGGRHSRWFLDRGCKVTAVDRQIDALEAVALADARKAAALEIVRADLEDGSAWPLGGRRFDAVVVVNYLWRPLFASILEVLAPKGVLLYETFAAGQQALGKPRNPDFLLTPGELLRLVGDRLQVVAFEQGRITTAGGPAIKQRIAAIAGTSSPVPLTAD